MAKRRCFGRCRDGSRCKNPLKTGFFCIKHRWQFGVTAFTGTVTIVSLLLSAVGIAKDRQNLQALYEVAMGNYRNGNLTEATALFAKIYEEQPRYPNVAYYYGVLLLPGDPAQALAALSAVPDRERGQHKDLTYLLGGIYYNKGDYRNARVHFTNALEDLDGDFRKQVVRGLLISTAHKTSSPERMEAAVDSLSMQIDQEIKNMSVITSQVGGPEFRLGIGHMMDREREIGARQHAVFALLAEVARKYLSDRQYESAFQSVHRAAGYVTNATYLTFVSEQQFARYFSTVSGAAAAVVGGRGPDSPFYGNLVDMVERLAAVQEGLRSWNTPQALISMRNDYVALLHLLYLDGSTEMVVESDNLSLEFHCGWADADGMRSVEVSGTLPGVTNTVIDVGGEREYTWEATVLVSAGDTVRAPAHVDLLLEDIHQVRTPVRCFPVIVVQQ